MSQSNVKFGPVPFNCGEDLTAANDHLVVLGHDTGTPQMTLPDSLAALTLYPVSEHVEAIPAADQLVNYQNETLFT